MSEHPGDRLSALVDGGLPAAEAAMVEAHLATCPACAAERNEVAVARAIVRGLPLLVAPPGVLVPAPAVHQGDAISARLDGELDATAAMGVDAHLAACPACAAERDEVAWSRRLVRALPAVDPPPGALRPRLVPLPAPRVPSRPRRRAWAAVAAAVAGVAVGATGLTSGDDEPAPVQPQIVSFVADHSTSSPSPDPITGLAPGVVPVSFSP